MKDNGKEKRKSKRKWIGRKEEKISGVGEEEVESA